MDLSAWNAEEKPIIDLVGEWEFYWNQLIDPRTAEFENPDGYISGSSVWNSFQMNDQTIGGYGYATYRLLLINIPEVHYNLLVRNVLSACKVFVNGQEITEVGKVGTSKADMTPMYENRIVSLEQGHAAMEIVVWISNFHHRNGGMPHPFKLGKEENQYALQRQQIMLDGVISSCYLFAGVFFLTLWIFRKKDKPLLFISLFCLTIVPRALASNNYMIMTVLPDLNWYIVIYTEYLSMLLPTGFMLLFVRERFPDQAPKKLLNYLAIFMFLEAAVVIVTPPSIFSWLVITHQWSSLISFVVMLWIIIKAMKARVNGAIFGGTAIICLISWATLIIFRHLEIIDPVPYLMTGLQIGFLLSMSLILGARFSANYTKVEGLQATTEEQRAQLEVKNEEILASISYAKRIQEAILPPKDFLPQRKPNAFILYLPKDIVAGDFYWVDEYEGKLIFAVADCTGHGVPGAMVSVVCHSALNRTLREFGISNPAKILDKTRELVLESFSNTYKSVRDGMDIALCVLDLATNKLQFAGANNPLCIIPANKSKFESLNYDRKVDLDDRVLYEFKGNKQPIGYHPNATSFDELELQLEKGDKVYLFSDGYPDQFGGEKSKKMMYKPFKQMLLSYSAYSFQEQLKNLRSSFEMWKGDMDQTDDVCVMGVEI